MAITLTVAGRQLPAVLVWEACRQCAEATRFAEFVCAQFCYL